MCVPWVAKLRGFSIDQGSNPIEVVEPMKTCVVKPMYAAFSPKYYFFKPRTEISLFNVDTLVFLFSKYVNLHSFVFEDAE